MFMIYTDIFGDWQPLFYDKFRTRHEAELALFDHWRYLDIAQEDYKMDSYCIEAVKSQKLAEDNNIFVQN